MQKNSKYERFTVKTVVQIGIQTIEQLKQLHQCGFVHNDLKPANLLLGSKNMKDQNSSSVVLIDFGFSKPFHDGSGKHIKCEDVKEFRGNFLFSSPNAFRYENLSRKDDLISLGNILVYLLLGDAPWSDFVDTNKNVFSQVRQIKLEQTPETMCTGAAR